MTDMSRRNFLFCAAAALPIWGTATLPEDKIYRLIFHWNPKTGQSHTEWLDELPVARLAS